MPINAMIPMMGTKVTVPDEQGMAVRAQNIISSKDTMRRNAVLDKQRKTQLDNAEMDAEQKDSLAGMSRIHQAEQGWVNKYMRDGLDEQTANQKAIETVAPYAQTELDHHNKRYHTAYTMDDVNKARQPMHQIQTQVEEQTALADHKFGQQKELANMNNASRLNVANVNAENAQKLADINNKSRLNVANVNATNARQLANINNANRLNVANINASGREKAAKIRASSTKKGKTDTVYQTNIGPVPLSKLITLYKQKYNKSGVSINIGADGTIDSGGSDKESASFRDFLVNDYGVKLPNTKGDTGSEKPPMAGAKKAPDGNWYIQKNGKYYMVNP